MKPNFELITELQTLTRRDFALADSALLAPVGSNPLVDGEFLEIDGSYKLIRGSAAEGTSMLVYPVHTERGRYDTQAIGKVNVLMLGQYEAETYVIDPTSLTLGAALTINTLGAPAGAFQNKRGLALKTGANVVVVGYVSRLYTTEKKVRFVHYANVLVP
jgi:hypothetical protein